MINSVTFIGEPLDFNGKLKIYPPRVKDVVTNPNFGVFYKILTMNQEDIRDEVAGKLKEGEPTPTPFEYFILSCQYINGFALIAREAFKFFCKTDIGFLFDERRIIIGNVEDLIQNIDSVNDIEYLTDGEFFDFQNMIRESCGDKPVKPPEPENPDEDPRIRKIKEKARERDRIKAKQAGKNGISLSTCLVAICCMGIGITPLNIGEMSYASVGEIMKVMQDKEKYDIDIRSLLAGADSKKVKPKYWIRNSDKE